MPSPNAFALTDHRVICQLRPIKDVEDAYTFMRTRTDDTHQLGTDAALVLRRLKARGSGVFIVENGIGITIGAATLTETEPGIAIVGLAMLPEFRGRGYGRATLKELEKEARRLGFMAIRADVYETNVEATVLFERAGYRRFHRYEKAI